MTKSKIYHISIPFEKPNTGDYDYGTALVQALNDQGQAAEYVTAATAGYTLGSSGAVDTVRNAVELVNNERNHVDMFNAAYNVLRVDPSRIDAINKIKSHILEDAKAARVVPILNLQLRAPETGFAFMPEDLEDFKRAGIKVNVTCHEYKLNNTRRHLQSVLHGYFKAADSVTFFNPKDRHNACKHADKSAFADKTKFPEGDGLFATLLPYGLESKAFLTRVPPTVSYVRPTFKEFQERPPNLIAFGLIRENKGFEEALDIAESINNRVWPLGKKPKMIIAGAPSSPALLSKIIASKFDDQSLRQIISKNNKPYVENPKVMEAAIASVYAKYQKTLEAEKLSKNSDLRRLVDVKLRETSYTSEQKANVYLSVAKYCITQKVNITSDTEVLPASLNNKAWKGIVNSVTNLTQADHIARNDNVWNIDPSTITLRLRDDSDANIRALDQDKRFNTAIIKEMNAALDKDLHEALHGIVDTKMSSGQIDSFVEGLSSRRDLSERSPIDIRLNVPSDQMPALFQQAKYAVKIDNKGWANNASGHINAFANGCIVYTGWGMDTPDEVLPARTKGDRDIDAGQYHEALPFLAEKYGMKRDLTVPEEQGGAKGVHYDSRKSSKVSERDPITADKVLTDLVRRESSIEFQSATVCSADDVLSDVAKRESAEGSNSLTFQRAERLFNEQFAPSAIATKFVQDLASKHPDLSREVGRKEEERVVSGVDKVSKFVQKFKERVSAKVSVVDIVAHSGLPERELSHSAFPGKKISAQKPYSGAGFRYTSNIRSSKTPGH